ncbi:MAG TPA: mechanosensitive ion channel [Thermoanaerobaculia bacterium]|nr:mechanosensitive ion channel [Thermoanaerobaculia bacterium]HUM30001.1 mechanosensitive ion channel [Thermoanaerobaculia bacterium]HXK68310.1 mechanosensitive ion channel [Thermoanaerobaculia bacterium]
MENLVHRFFELYMQNPGFFDKVAESLVVILFLWFLRRLVLFLAFKRVEELRSRYSWKKSTLYSAFFVGLFAISQIWLSGLAHLSTFLGLLSAGIAIALKDPITNIAGWVFLIWRKPFTVGDRIQIGEHTGDVIDIRIFQFSILEIGKWVRAEQSTGRIIHVPNSQVFFTPLANYTMDFPFIWTELSILVTFESNWKAAKALIQDLCRDLAGDHAREAERYLKEATKKWFIVFNRLDPIVYTSVEDSGVALTARFLCPPRQRRSTEERLWEAILEKFSERDDMDFAYPTIRYYDQGTEGKRVPE